MKRKIICALDTGSLTEAKETVRRLAPYSGAFKVGYALTLQNGLDVIDILKDEGAERIFLDLKFHDIPNSVGRAVREASRRGVWMMTLHIAGGPAMVTAAVEEAKSLGPEKAPMLLGVSVLTSLDQHVLSEHLGIGRTIEEHMVYLSRLGVDCGLDGVVCSVHEIKAIRAAIGHSVIVTPGIRGSGAEKQDQQRVGDARSALDSGADYLVIGRALTDAQNPLEALKALGLESEEWQAV
jgi:orotidine-5'-phosphate decarboxylase